MTTKNDTLDPRHRPQFQPGFVLGAQDLRQEWTWLDGRDRWLAREAIGYGTLRGLAVSVHDGDGGAHEIRVGPGVALDPAGRLICVSETQCATLEGWLAQERAEGRDTSDSIYVVLRYEAVACEGVPARGDACCSEAAAPVRLRDGFQLGLSRERPRHLEHRALRAWRRLIAGVRVVEEGEALPPIAWEARIRRAFAAILAPDEVEPLVVSADQAQAFLRLAERLFVTELWPETTEDAGSSGARGLELTEADAGVLLATLRIRTGEFGGVAVEEDDRPILAPAAAILGGGSASEETDGAGSTGGESVGVTAELKGILDELVTTRQAELDLLERRIEGLAAEIAGLRQSTGAGTPDGGTPGEGGTGDSLPGYEPLDDHALASRISAAVNAAKEELYTGLRGELDDYAQASAGTAAKLAFRSLMERDSPERSSLLQAISAALSAMNPRNSGG